jgi:YegS/Rv2252/BmrU family lipid kinase
MPARVILNPYAGRWLAQQRRGEAESAMRSAGIEFDLQVTEKPGHGQELAARAVEQGFAPIIAAGGDGTISEIVNGMLQASNQAAPPPLGILPLGTANDLVKNLGLPLDLPEAARTIAAGTTRPLDIGQVSHGNPPRTRYFDNNSAMGLEPTVTLIQQRITRLRGTLRYLVATLMSVAQNPSWEVSLAWDGGEYEGLVSLVTVGNCALTGGLFYMTPHANPFDSKLTFVYGYLRTRRSVLGILPRTMKPAEGSYVEHPAIHEVHSSWLKISSRQPTPLHADGEIQSEVAQEIEYRVIPGKLPILTAQAG